MRQPYNEHSEFKWLNYHEAIELLKWDSNKVALWELYKRLLDLIQGNNY